jgi:transposase InsO family protein
VKVVAETLGVARSNLIDRLSGRKKPRRRYHKAQDAAVVPLITTLVAKPPTYGYRRITAILNRQLRSEGLAPVNHKRVYRIMQAHNLLLARKYTERPEHVHDGKVIVMRSNLRWCSDGFEFTCWNGDIVRGAFIIDAHDREIIAWRAVVNVGISGSDIRDIMLEAVERRFGAYRSPSLIEILTDNGSLYIARQTQIFARQLGLKPCFTPVQSWDHYTTLDGATPKATSNLAHALPLDTPDAKRPGCGHTDFIYLKKIGWGWF